MKKRLRVFAGPNGSGKSTLFEQFTKKYNAGHFVNADLIEAALDTVGFIDLEEYGIRASQTDWELFLEQEEALSLVQKSKEEGHEINLSIKDNFIIDPSKSSHSYEGALVSSFLRHALVKNNQSFSFESVMSHPSKLSEIERAKLAGYVVYLYFICTDNPEVNISRVANRKQKGGHDVDRDRITKRYAKTLENLYPAIKLCDKIYLFDNSGKELELIAEVIEKALTTNVHESKLPNWLKNYVLTHYI